MRWGYSGVRCGPHRRYDVSQPPSSNQTHDGAQSSPRHPLLHPPAHLRPPHQVPTLGQGIEEQGASHVGTLWKGGVEGGAECQSDPADWTTLVPTLKRARVQDLISIHAPKRGWPPVTQAVHGEAAFG